MQNWLILGLVIATDFPNQCEIPLAKYRYVTTPGFSSDTPCITIAHPAGLQGWVRYVLSSGCLNVCL